MVFDLSQILKEGEKRAQVSQPNKYFEGEPVFDEQEEESAKKIVKSEEVEDAENLSDDDIEKLCSKFLMNKLYYKLAKTRKRETALKVAANVIVKKGEKIQEQLQLNDLKLKKDTSVKDKIGKEGLGIKDVGSNSKNQQSENSTNLENKNLENSSENSQENSTSDIAKISGGTLSEVIAKITEMMAGKSGPVLGEDIANFGAMVEVLASPGLEDKFADTMNHLGKDPVLVADIQDLLKDSPASQVFNDAIENNLGTQVKSAVNQVSASDLAARRQENITKENGLDGQFSR